MSSASMTSENNSVGSTWFRSIWDAVSGRVTKTVTAAFSQDHLQEWTAWDSLHGVLLSTKILNFRSIGGSPDEEGVLSCALVKERDQGTLFAIVWVFMGKGNPLQTYKDGVSGPWLQLKFGILKGVPVCVSFFEKDRQERIYTFAAQDGMRMKWQRAIDAMKEHLPSRNADAGFLQRYDLTVISEETLEAIYTEAIEHVGRRGRRELGGI